MACEVHTDFHGLRCPGIGELLNTKSKVRTNDGLSGAVIIGLVAALGVAMWIAFAVFPSSETILTEASKYPVLRFFVSRPDASLLVLIMLAKVGVAFAGLLAIYLLFSAPELFLQLAALFVTIIGVPAFCLLVLAAVGKWAWMTLFHH